MATKIRGSNFSPSATTTITSIVTENSVDSALVNGLIDSAFTAKSTSDLSEGSNLYYTTARADSDAKAAISVTDAGGDGSLSYSSGTITYTGPSASEVRAHFSAGTGVSISSGQVSIGQSVGTSDNVSFADVTLTGALNGPSTFYIDPAPVDSDAGLLVIRGDLQVDGTTTTVNSTTVSINDKNIVLADSAANAAEADGAGITVNGASATIQYDAVADAWDFNKDVDVTGTVTADDAVYVEGSSPRVQLQDTDGTLQLSFLQQSGEDTFLRLRNNTASGGFTIAGYGGGSTVNRIYVKPNGDISFYDNTGATQGLFWDASTQRLGLGTTSPTNALHISSSDGETVLLSNSNAAGNSQIKFDGSTDFQIGTGQASSGFANKFFLYDATNAATRMVIDNSGDVGIGTTSPNILNWSKAVTLNHAAGNSAYEVALNGAAKAYFGYAATGFAVAAAYGSDSFHIRTSNTDRLTISSSGYPRFIGSGDGYAYLEIDTNTADKGQWRFQVDSNPSTAKFYLQDYSGGSWNTNLTVDHDGRVGIGTASPNSIYKMDVIGDVWIRGDTSDYNATLSLGKFEDSTTPLIDLTTDDVSADSFTIHNRRWGHKVAFSRSSQGGGPVETFLVEGSSSTSLKLYHQTSPSTSTATEERVRLTTDGNSFIKQGNFGIGTTSPGYPLELAVGAGTAQRISRGGNYIDFGGLSSGTVYMKAYEGRVAVGNAYTGYLDLITGDTAKVTIDNPGNVIIGTTNAQLLVGLSTSTEQVHIKKSTNTGLRLETTNTNGIANFDLQNDARLYRMRINGNNSDAWELYDNTAGTTRLVLNASGNVGIGTTSPQYPLHVKGTNVPIVSQSTSTGAGPNYLLFKDSANTNLGYVGYGSSNKNLYLVNYGSDPIIFYNSSEKMRIDSSGNLLVGTTSATFSETNYGIGLKDDAESNWVVNTAANIIAFSRGSNGNIFKFFRSGEVGSVYASSTGTTYNTTSDIRLKTDIAPISDATDKLMAMNAVSHKWKSDPDADAVHGFIAQEMAEIVPEAVKKGEGEDDMWSMDYGRITPVIVAALQDALKEIDMLKDRIAELEAK